MATKIYMPINTFIIFKVPYFVPRYPARIAHGNAINWVRSNANTMDTESSPSSVP